MRLPGNVHRWYEKAGSAPLERWPQMGGKEMTMHSEWTSPEKRKSERKDTERDLDRNTVLT